jgi:protein-disulfide isomerase
MYDRTIGGMEETTNGSGSKKRDVLLPASIIIAGVLVAGAVIWSVGKRAEGPVLTAGLNAPAGPDVVAMRLPDRQAGAVDGSDHVRGARDANVTIVEYSDFECPYCKNFHETMKEILASYESDVAWVYRQYPIAGLHTKAAKESEASECTAELGGNDAFWKFADRIFEVTPSNDGLDLATLPAIAEYAGIVLSAFESCMASGRHADAVAASVAEAEQLGIHGTPYAVFVAKGSVNADDFGFLSEINQQSLALRPSFPAPFTVDETSGRIGMSGAYPLELVTRIVDALINNQ